MIEKRLIAICDVLGYEKTLKSRALKEIVDSHLKYFKKSISHSITQKSIATVPSIKELKRNHRVGFFWFSDTLLFYSLHDNIDSHRKVIETVGWLLFETMYCADTRLRIGVSYGDVYIDVENEIFMGQPIVDAYKLEQIQDWSGGALTESAVAKFSESENWLIHYEVPIKHKLFQKKFIPTLAINWTIGGHTKSNFSWSESQTTPKFKDYFKQKDIIRKWKNTKKFHDKTCKFCTNCT